MIPGWASVKFRAARLSCAQPRNPLKSGKEIFRKKLFHNINNTNTGPSQRCCRLPPQTFPRRHKYSHSRTIYFFRMKTPSSKNLPDGGRRNILANQVQACLHASYGNCVFVPNSIFFATRFMAEKCRREARARKPNSHKTSAKAGHWMHRVAPESLQTRGLRGTTRSQKQNPRHPKGETNKSVENMQETKINNHTINKNVEERRRHK